MSRLARKVLAVLLVPAGLLASAVALFVWQFSAFKQPIDDKLFWPFLACVVATVALPVLIWPRALPDGDRSGARQKDQARFRRSMMFVAGVSCILVGALAAQWSEVPAALATLSPVAVMALLRKPDGSAGSSVPLSVSIAAFAVAVVGLVSAYLMIVEPLAVALGVFGLATVYALVRRTRPAGS